MKKKYLIMFGLLALCLIFSFLVGYNRGRRIITDPHITTKTDTIYIQEPYKPIEIPKDTLKPKVVIFWKTDSSKLSEYELKLRKDSIMYSLIIKSLRDSIIVSELFLKNFPRNPKLLGLSLYRDSLNLITMDISGITKTEKYNLFLQNYSYLWNINGIGYSKVNYPKEKKQLISHYLGLSYDILNKKLLPNYQIRLNLSKVELNLTASQELMFHDKPELRIGVNYKLNKR